MIQYFSVLTSTKEKLKEARRRVGSRLKVLRNKNNDYQKDLAEELGISASLISRVEKGEADIKASMVPFLAEKYGVLAETFFNDDGKAYPDMILKLVRSAGYTEHEDTIMKCISYQVDNIVNSDKSYDFLSVFFLALQAWERKDAPVDYLDEKLPLIREGKIVEEYIKMAKERVNE